MIVSCMHPTVILAITGCRYQNDHVWTVTFMMQCLAIWTAISEPSISKCLLHWTCCAAVRLRCGTMIGFSEPIWDRMFWITRPASHELWSIPSHQLKLFWYMIKWHVDIEDREREKFSGIHHGLNQEVLCNMILFTWTQWQQVKEYYITSCNSAIV